MPRMQGHRQARQALQRRPKDRAAGRKRFGQPHRAKCLSYCEICSPVRSGCTAFALPQPAAVGYVVKFGEHTRAWHRGFRRGSWVAGFRPMNSMMNPALRSICGPTIVKGEAGNPGSCCPWPTQCVQPPRDVPSTADLVDFRDGPAFPTHRGINGWGIMRQSGSKWIAPPRR